MMYSIKNYITYVIGGALVCFFILLTGCSTSKLVDVWSDSSFQPPSLNKILVISVGKNAARRRIWEDAFSVEFAKHGVWATPSYRLFPDIVPDTNQVIEAVTSNGFDGVLVSHRLPSETTSEYVKGYVTKERDSRFDRRRQRFVTYYRDIEHVGYIDSEKVAIRGFDVWETKNDGQIIWSARSKTPEPSTIQEVRPEIIQLVMAELTKQGIIADKK